MTKPKHMPVLCQDCGRPAGRRKRRIVAGKVYCRRCADAVENMAQINADQAMFGDTVISEEKP